MKLMRQVVVFDAVDLAAESAFSAGMFDGQMLADDTWHSVFDADGQWVIGVQLAPDHVAPDWPDGNPQQVHLDLHIDDAASAHAKASALGARLLRAADDLTAPEGHQVYADPPATRSASVGDSQTPTRSAGSCAATLSWPDGH